MRECDALRGGSALRHCSTDRVQVWHGAATPAIACGFHATYDLRSVFLGHNAAIIEGEDV